MSDELIGDELEMRAIEALTEMLRPLTPAQRCRVLVYVLDRLDSSLLREWSFWRDRPEGGQPPEQELLAGLPPAEGEER
jgi:hypothetical protein